MLRSKRSQSGAPVSAVALDDCELKEGDHEAQETGDKNDLVDQEQLLGAR